MFITINNNRLPMSSYTKPLYRAVIISLFTWRRAKANDDTNNLYGWWGDSYPTYANDKIGSRLYLLLRQKLVNKTAVIAKGYIEESLEWMKKDGIVKKIDVTVIRSGLKTLNAKIVFYKNDGTLEDLTFNNLWGDINE